LGAQTESRLLLQDDIRPLIDIVKRFGINSDKELLVQLAPEARLNITHDVRASTHHSTSAAGAGLGFFPTQLRII